MTIEREASPRDYPVRISGRCNFAEGAEVAGGTPHERREKFLSDLPDVLAEMGMECIEVTVSDRPRGYTEPPTLLERADRWLHNPPPADWTCARRNEALELVEALSSALTEATERDDKTLTCSCGLPMSKNPHPNAGNPGALVEVGAVYVCIPCSIVTRHRWADRALRAEADLTSAIPVAVKRRATSKGGTPR